MSTIRVPGTVYIPVRCIRSIDIKSSGYGRCMAVEADMSEAMMYDALNSMLTRVSGETWARWVKQINRETDPDHAPKGGGQ